jgi:hypothetical protein
MQRILSSNNSVEAQYKKIREKLINLVHILNFLEKKVFTPRRQSRKTEDATGA